MQFRRRFVIHARRRYDFVAVEEVVCLTALGGTGSTVHGVGRTWALRQGLTALECQLDPRMFCRIHRSTIVNLAKVRRLETGIGGRAMVRLYGYDPLLHVARNRVFALRQALRIEIVPAIALRPLPSPAIQNGVRLGAFVGSRSAVDVLDTACLERVGVDGNYLVFYSSNGNVRTRGSLHAIAQALEPLRFVRISRSALVNVAHIVRIELDRRSNYTVMLESGKRLRVGPMFRQQLSGLLRGQL